MGLTNHTILGIQITTSSKQHILEEIRKYLKKLQSPISKLQIKEVKPYIILTPNPEIVSYAQHDGYFKKLVNSAQINIPDGWGICWALKKTFGVDCPRISGTDFMEELSREAAKIGLVIGLIGGKDHVAVKAVECLRVKYPTLKAVVFPAPHIRMSRFKQNESSMKGDENTKNKTLSAKYMTLNTGGSQTKVTTEYFVTLTEEIQRNQIDILFVAFGFPKQEYFIEGIKHQALRMKYKRPLVIMAVGGAFDFLSGNVSRAPRWMREKGLEWLFRLLSSPFRVFRQIRGAEFFYKIFTVTPS